MRKLPFILATLAVSAALSGTSWAERITVPETTVSFEATAEFTALSDEEIKAKYPPSRAPRFVLGNASRGTTVAYEIRAHAIPDGALEQAMAAFEQVFSRIIPGIAGSAGRSCNEPGSAGSSLRQRQTPSTPTSTISC